LLSATSANGGDSTRIETEIETRIASTRIGTTIETTIVQQGVRDHPCRGSLAVRPGFHTILSSSSRSLSRSSSIFIFVPIVVPIVVGFSHVSLHPFLDCSIEKPPLIPEAPDKKTWKRRSPQGIMVVFQVLGKEIESWACSM